MKSARLALVSCVLTASFVACFEEGYPEQHTAERRPPQEAGTEPDVSTPDADPPDDLVVNCTPSFAGEGLRARSAVMSDEVESGVRTVFVADLFRQFATHCGSCHVDNNVGDFQVTLGTFSTAITADVLARIKSEDPVLFMPPLPVGKPWAERAEGDPIVELVTNLEAWMAAGSPTDLYTVDVTGDGGSPYLLSKDVGNLLTNIGNCVPDKLLYAAPKSDELDELFAEAQAKPPGEGTLLERIGLPEHLKDTDLFTLDSKVLAQHGVVAYSPTYPLWSDGSGKLRHVRVPRGKSIEYNPETQQLEIPENTRFYKTFLKKVIDESGQESFRKIETRIIVARPDVTLEDGTVQPTALFGTYAWNEEETDATLVTDPLRNGEPFRDRLFTYVLDEPKAAEIYASDVPNKAVALEKAGVLRHYAIPGSERCVQCHMGSPSASFVLGFTPLQVHKVPVGESGVIEASGPDELSQLERLIDYGVITGFDPAKDVVRLEDSQGKRRPRNDAELVAQGYLLGNCSHCHNPRGYPTIINPELGPLLDFLPSEGGGIFQFPLERVSPRIKRGKNGDIPIPYITPSVQDLYPEEEYKAGIYTDKFVTEEVLGKEVYDHMEAPWRSLIYRNVDTPFTYAEAYAIFPHMPMNTAGFDCRAPRIVAEWMLSVPAARINSELSEEVRPSVAPNSIWDNTPQPYAEIKPGDEGYEEAVEAAEARVTSYQSDDRYPYCPDNSDIVDPAILRGDRLAPADVVILRNDLITQVLPKDGVPDRAHFVATDLTEVPGDWYPRRNDWAKVLIDHDPPDLDPNKPGYAEALKAQEAEMKVVGILDNVTVTEAFKTFATTPRPYGTWLEKETCAFPGVKRVQEYAGAERMPWMDSVKPEAHAFEALPGEMVYGMICANCHGPKANAQGIQAKTVADLTGGDARVANFMNGLFGPVGSSGSNLERVFGGLTQGTPETMGSRYMSWMALGGTQREIPASVLDLVARADVLGISRRGFFVQGSANMLAVAEGLCLYTLPLTSEEFDVETATADVTQLIHANGDAALWTELCARENRSIVRVLFPGKALEPWSETTSRLYVVLNQSLRSGQTYPVGAQVGNHRGKITTWAQPDASGSQPDNFLPWCVAKPTNQQEKVHSDAFVNAHAIDGVPLPYCPDGLQTVSEADRQAWTTRGSINAGFAVFQYLQQLAQGLREPRRYDQCEDLEK